MQGTHSIWFFFFLSLLRCDTAEHCEIQPDNEPQIQQKVRTMEGTTMKRNANGAASRITTTTRTTKQSSTASNKLKTITAEKRANAAKRADQFKQPPQSQNKPNRTWKSQNPITTINYFSLLAILLWILYCSFSCCLAWRLNLVLAEALAALLATTRSPREPK